MKNTVKRDHCATKVTNEEVSKSLLNTSSSADRVRRWYLLHAIGHHFGKFNMSVDDLEIKRWKDQLLRQQLGRFSISLPMRFFFKALEEKVDQQDSWTLGFLTVNFSHALTEKIANEKTRSPAGNYANRVNNKFRKHGIRAQWFGVLEDQRGNLHCHGLIGFHKDDEAKIKQCLKADTDMDSGIRLQTTYRRRRKQQPSSVAQALVTTKSFIPNLLQEANVDIGAADYISKMLEKISNYMDTGKCRIYVPNELRSAAETLYEDMRDKQNRFRSATFDTTTLNCHQALTYLIHGWVPKAISADEARLDEQQMEDIDNALAWEHFRNSEPAYDWEYEEDDPSVNAYFDAEQEMTEGLSESEYDRMVKEAELLMDQSACVEEMTEGEYEMLMQEISHDLEQYHQEQPSWQAPTGPEISDADIDAFLEQQMLSFPENRKASSSHRRYFQPQSAAGNTKGLALSAGNISLKQLCMTRQVTTDYGARHPPLPGHLHPLYSPQRVHLRRFGAWPVAARRVTGKQPHHAHISAIKHYQHYQIAGITSEWPPPATSYITCYRQDMVSFLHLQQRGFSCPNVMNISTRPKLESTNGTPRSTR